MLCTDPITVSQKKLSQNIQGKNKLPKLKEFWNQIAL